MEGDREEARGVRTSASGLPTFELRPQVPPARPQGGRGTGRGARSGPRAGAGGCDPALSPEAQPTPRVVGPGRRELAYLQRIEGIESELLTARRELETADLVERGSARLLDRIERELQRTSEQKNRLLVTLGVLQRDNQILARRARLAEARLARLESGPTGAGRS